MGTTKIAKRAGGLKVVEPSEITTHEQDVPWAQQLDGYTWLIGCYCSVEREGYYFIVTQRRNRWHVAEVAPRMGEEVGTFADIDEALEAVGEAICDDDEG